MDLPSTDALSEKPRKRPKRRWVLRAIAASVLAGLLFGGWHVLQPLIPSLMPLGAGFSLTGDSGRVGHPSAAPVMRQCLRVNSPEAFNMYYTSFRILLLKASAEIIFGNDVEAPANLALIWGGLARCATIQEGRALCDINNRAAAVQALTRFMLYAKQADVFLKKISPAASLPQMKEIDALKSLLLTALKNHRRDGIFVASDFGIFQPAEISQIMREEQTIRNICAG